jgi:hypothetical protein
MNQARPEDAAVTAIREAHLIELRRKAQRAEISLWGSLLITGATAAARAGDSEEAQDLLQVAHGAAVRLGEDRNDYQTAFGAGQVVMQRVDVAVVAGDYVQALDAAAAMPQVTSLPLAARSRHKADLAHANAGLGRYAQAELSCSTSSERRPSGCGTRYSPVRWSGNCSRRAARPPGCAASSGSDPRPTDDRSPGGATVAHQWRAWSRG